MRQRQVLKEVADGLDMKQTEVKEIVDTFVDVLREQLLDHNEVQLDGLGVFSLLKHKEKNAVIPGKAEPVIIPSHFKLQFKSASSLKEDLQTLEK